MYFRKAVFLLVASWAFSSLVATAAEGNGPDDDAISKKAEQLGTNIPQNNDARAVLLANPKAKLAFPGLLIGLEKAPIDSVGCPANRGLRVDEGAPEIGDHLKKTLNYVYIDNGKETLQVKDGYCLFVSHTVEFVQSTDSIECKPRIVYSAYRDDPSIPARDAYGKGREGLLALKTRLQAIVEDRAKIGEATTHFIVFATGWNTPQLETLQAMDEIYASIKAAADRERTPYNPLLIGISWPSYSQDIAEKAAELPGKIVGRFESVIPDFVPEKFPDGLDHASEFIQKLLKTPKIASGFGRFGYPVLSKDADEIGAVWASTLVNQVLMPLRAEIAGKPRVVVIGHSFGARIATWSAFTGPLLPPVDGVAGGNGPDVIIGLQGAFPAGRFDKKAASEHDRRPYHEGAPFASFKEKRTRFAYTGSSHDYAVKIARPFDITIGDNLAFKNRKRFTDDLFDRRTTEGDKVGALRLLPDAPPASRKVLLIDASSIIDGHNDVRNLEAGWLIWNVIQSNP
jgi:pimeloyl-ACP methyl ester carboxylesterase